MGFPEISGAYKACDCPVLTIATGSQQLLPDEGGQTKEDSCRSSGKSSRSYFIIRTGHSAREGRSQPTLQGPLAMSLR